MTYGEVMPVLGKSSLRQAASLIQTIAVINYNITA